MGKSLYVGIDESITEYNSRRKKEDWTNRRKLGAYLWPEKTAGTRSSTLSQWSLGNFSNANCSIEVLDKMAGYFGCTICELIKYK